MEVKTFCGLPTYEGWFHIKNDDSKVQRKYVALANGVVYLGGSVPGAVRALDAGSGVLLWSSTTATKVSPELVVVNGMLYVAAGFDDVSYLNAFSLNGQ